jgi:Group II intron, maturase-specific domain
VAAGGSPTTRLARLNLFTIGWMAYFRLVDTGNLVRETDRWLRRRLRQIRWKEWKTTAARRHNLRVKGISESNVRKWGGSSKGYWRIAGSQVLGVALPNTYWNHLGLETMTATRQRFNSACGCRKCRHLTRPANTRGSGRRAGRVVGRACCRLGARDGPCRRAVFG